LGNSVFDTTARVYELNLGVNWGDEPGGKAIEPDNRRLAYGFQDGFAPHCHICGSCIGEMLIYIGEKSMFSRQGPLGFSPVNSFADRLFLDPGSHKVLCNCIRWAKAGKQPASPFAHSG
jgi:hypothetical protein